MDWKLFERAVCGEEGTSNEERRDSSSGQENIWSTVRVSSGQRGHKGGPRRFRRRNE